MNIEPIARLILNQEDGYQWYSKNDVHVIGYIINKHKMEGEELCNYIAELSLNDLTTIKDKLNRLNGIYAFIWKKEDQYYLITDRIRNFSLFFYLDLSQTLITDDPYMILEQNNLSINKDQYSYFKASGYTLNNETLFEKIYEVKPGEITIIDNKKHQHHPYYQLQEYPSHQEEDLIEVLDKIFEDTFKAIGDRPIALPLTGGYDSRLIAAYCKKHNRSPYCYTYGRAASPEIRNAQLTAERLGFKWEFIAYNDYDKEKDPSFESYYQKMGHISSSFFLQDFPALKYLKKKLPSNTVFIGGHSADMIAGSKIKKDDIKISDDKKRSQAILKDITVYHHLKKREKKKALSLIQSEFIFNSFKDLIYSNMINRQARLINNSTLIFSHFGFQHFLPFWHHEFVNFFLSASFEDLYLKRLYNNTLENHIFSSYNIQFESTEVLTSKKFSLQKLKDRIKPYLPSSIQEHFINKNDILNYQKLTHSIQKELRVNQVPFKIKQDYNSVLIQWYLWKVRK